MESGNSFDGQNIPALFATPFIPIQDPQLRKTFYKMALYIDPEGSADIDFNLRLNFNQTDTIQPNTIKLSNDTDLVSIFGSPTTIYGTSIYGGKLVNMFMVQVIGSGFTVSLRYECNDTNPPFSLDAATLEYALFDRR
jgi:hypothetical protein